MVGSIVAIGMGLAVIGAGLGDIRANMILMAAFIEGAALIALILSFLVANP